MTRPFTDVAIIGAGPYGLSLAAHLAARGVEHRLFGDPMGTWKGGMPAGMLLKSYPWATCLSDPNGESTLKRFCAEHAQPYHDEMTPLPLERFVAYGEAFRERHVPAVELRTLVSLASVPGGFEAAFDDGTTVAARRVVLAVGMMPFRRLPRYGLPEEMLSHSADHGPLATLEGKEVAIVGTGASAIDLAALLHERGVRVTLTGRAPKLRFADRPRARSLFQRLRAPMGGIGPGWTLGAYAMHPEMVRLLPQETRLRLAAGTFGPLGGAFMKERVLGRVPLLLGHGIRSMGMRSGRAAIDLEDAEGRRRTLHADHVLFATGFEVDVQRLAFIGAGIGEGMRVTGGAPQLSRHYESSVPGLHFVGPAASATFGPVSRFVYGAAHPARVLAAHFAATLPRRLPSPSVRPVEIEAKTVLGLVPDLLPDLRNEPVFLKPPHLYRPCSPDRSP